MGLRTAVGCGFVRGGRPRHQLQRRHLQRGPDQLPPTRLPRPPPGPYERQHPLDRQGNHALGGPARRGTGYLARNPPHPVDLRRGLGRRLSLDRSAAQTRRNPRHPRTPINHSSNREPAPPPTLQRSRALHRNQSPALTPTSTRHSKSAPTNRTHHTERSAHDKGTAHFTHHNPTPKRTEAASHQTALTKRPLVDSAQDRWRRAAHNRGHRPRPTHRRETHHQPPPHPRLRHDAWPVFSAGPGRYSSLRSIRTGAVQVERIQCNRRVPPTRHRPPSPLAGWLAARSSCTARWRSHLTAWTGGCPSPGSYRQRRVPPDQPGVPALNHLRHQVRPSHHPCTHPAVPRVNNCSIGGPTN
ncbi:hypothetical protein CLV40_13637 [Actinokineospora auranticolor]|uniref:Uncharacterized protein n=1 Tax=Actinokineospora auranticolor TaxID=155976 RepID=A0A2S6GC95_9PSEU|nr:hypothetical protein CLV40_13637 [Actinokineospora auranticolor]